MTAMQAPAHSLSYTVAAVERAFGAPASELFDEFPEGPVASGSIGQVYKARLSAMGARNTGIDPGAPLSREHSLGALCKQLTFCVASKNKKHTQ